ncbi:hypothetical protein CRM22_001347, partial [Opisthorchis felineus]
IIRHQEWLKQYFWILGDRIDISTSHLLRSMSRYDSNSMHLGFLRYWPLMNVEDCDRFTIERDMKVFLACKHQDLP